MKKTVAFLIAILAGNTIALSADNPDQKPLLSTLDETILHRKDFTAAKQQHIDSLKAVMADMDDDSERYRLNREIYGQYSTFICDSAETYIYRNMEIAERLGDSSLVTESRLNLALICSLSGLFVQADEIFGRIDYGSLPDNLKALYNWNRIRYCENIISYSADTNFIKDYAEEITECRKALLEILGQDSDMYLKEKAFLLQEEGRIDEAIGIFRRVFNKEKPYTHGWSMMNMGLYRLYSLSGDYEKAREHLIESAITDTRLAVKDNEALTVLATELYREKDYDRAYLYVKAALDDATFYNSRFKNTIIARVHPIIENTYMMRLNERNSTLRIYSILASILLVAFLIALVFALHQVRAVMLAKANLEKMNGELISVTGRLDEANIIKEKYIGYFVNKTAIYVNRLDEYRKTVIRKIKAGQTEDLCKESSISMEKDQHELYGTFDKTFLDLYPDFVAQFNSLLRPECHFSLEKETLNPELRIFALIRLGITDVRQIAAFLQYSLQTVYNYKSKVKKMSDMDADEFEEKVKKLSGVPFRQ